MHESSIFDSFAEALDGAEEFYTADLSALNSSGVTGTVLFAVDTDGEDGPVISVSVAGSGATPDQAHAQHVHGIFGVDGMPADSMSPGLANDMDGDGIVEVLEGLSSYGDVLMPLDDADGAFPVADSDGNFSFVQSYDAGDTSNFVSPVTATQYGYEDLADLSLREYVLHGLTVADGLGAGTGGEVNGTGGYVPILPVAAGEIERISGDQAMQLFEGQMRDAGLVKYLTGMDDTYLAGGGQDTVYAGRGDDLVHGNASADALFGNAGEDALYGDSGDDWINGASGMDSIWGGSGMDTVRGGKDDDMIHGGGGEDSLMGDSGADTVHGDAGDDLLVGGGGDDMLDGGFGADVIGGGAGMDTVMGGAGMDTLNGGADDDSLTGGTGDDLLLGQGGNDRLFGDDGDDTLSGGSGDDLLVGGAGRDAILGGAGNDIIGGLAGNDAIKGGAGMDEFHFDAGTGTDTILDFTQGEDVISLLDGGAVDFANSTEDSVRGDSDLSTDDFDMVTGYAGLDAANDQQVVWSSGGADDLMSGTGGAAVEAYMAASDGTDTYLYYDDDWSTLEGRETIAVLQDMNSALTVSDFDVY